MAFIGAVGNESSDAFNFMVCTAAWLARNFNDVRVPRWDYERENLLFGRKLVLMRRWDYEELHAAISEMCAGHEAADWGTLANRIGRYIPWEFDDRYDEFIDSTRRRSSRVSRRSRLNRTSLLPAARPADRRAGRGAARPGRCGLLSAEDCDAAAPRPVIVPPRTRER